MSYENRNNTLKNLKKKLHVTISNIIIPIQFTYIDKALYNAIKRKRIVNKSINYFKK